ncbi:hypothetical protein TWF481_000624 [Arthrobotrys musiformis]|uniref:Uncharacterized protein n=1 Tax=Arthrobotrys musiformis TaxID=47236 RepID=A0AAV9WNG2_9PEZI
MLKAIKASGFEDLKTTENMAPSGRWLQLYLLSLLSVPSLATPYTDHSTANIKQKGTDQSRCQFRPLGYIHPYANQPSKSTITLTKQGQPVTTYIPTATVCSSNTCAEVYATETYKWYSTWLPGPSGLQFVSRGDDTVTLPPAACATCGPRKSVKSHYCSSNGIHTIDGNAYQVYDAPRYIEYPVETGYAYQIADVDSYFQWLHNKTCGVTVTVTSINCEEGVCTHELQAWQKGQEVKEEVKSTTAKFEGYCAKAGACTISAQIPGYGKKEIVVEVKSKGSVTSVTAQELTITRTHVVTRTITRKTSTVTRTRKTKTITKTRLSSGIPSPCTSANKIASSKVLWKTTAGTPMATSSAALPTGYPVASKTKPAPTPKIESEFYLAIDVNPSIGGYGSSQTGGKLNSDYFVRFDNGNLTFSKNGWDVLPFSLSNSELTANKTCLKAFIDDGAAAASYPYGSAPVRMSVPGPQDTIAAISSFYDGYQHVLVWGTQRLAVGTAMAQFCIRKDASGNGGQIFVFWDAIAPEDCSLVALFILDGYVPPKARKPPVTKTITRTSSSAKTTTICTETSSASSQIPTSVGPKEVTSTSTSSPASSSTSTSSQAISTGTSSSAVPTDIPTDGYEYSAPTAAYESSAPTAAYESSAPTAAYESSAGTPTAVDNYGYSTNTPAAVANEYSYGGSGGYGDSTGATSYN